MSVVVVFGRFLNRFTICLEMQKVNSSSSSSNRQQTQSNRILPQTNFDSSSAKRREAFEAKHANAECCCCTVRLVPWLALGWLAGWLSGWPAGQSPVAAVVVNGLGKIDDSAGRLRGNRTEAE